MKAMLHEVTGKNRYCGPTAIATILGISTDHAAALVRQRNGLRAVKGMPTYMLAGVLRDAGCTVTHVGVSDKPTMAAWLARENLDAAKHCIVVFRNHYGVILGRGYLCSQTKRQRVRHADIPGRRGIVAEYLIVHSLPAAPPADQSAPRRVQEPGVRSAREQAKRLAALHDIELEPLDAGEWNVWPPEPIIDSDDDPHMGDHLAIGWSEVLERCQVYAGLLTKGA